MHTNVKVPKPQPIAFNTIHALLFIYFVVILSIAFSFIFNGKSGTEIVSWKSLRNIDHSILLGLFGNMIWLIITFFAFIVRNPYSGTFRLTLAIFPIYSLSYFLMIGYPGFSKFPIVISILYILPILDSIQTLVNLFKEVFEEFKIKGLSVFFIYCNPLVILFFLNFLYLGQIHSFVQEKWFNSIEWVFIQSKSFDIKNEPNHKSKTILTLFEGDRLNFSYEGRPFDDLDFSSNLLWRRVESETGLVGYADQEELFHDSMHFIQTKVKKYGTVAVTSLILRNLPSTSSNKITSLSENERFEILGESTNAILVDDRKGFWLYVRAKDNKEGYLFGGYTK